MRDIMARAIGVDSYKSSTYRYLMPIDNPDSVFCGLLCALIDLETYIPSEMICAGLLTSLPEIYIGYPSQQNTRGKNQHSMFIDVLHL